MTVTAHAQSVVSLEAPRAEFRTFDNPGLDATDDGSASFTALPLILRSLQDWICCGTDRYL